MWFKPKALSKYFTEKELACRCGCGLTVNQKVVRMLDRAREISDIPYIITSGARCAEYNAKIGASPTSSHIKGLAVDIAFKNSHDKFIILYGLMTVGFKRIGINETKNFIHVDLDNDKVQEVLFTY